MRIQLVSLIHVKANFFFFVSGRKYAKKLITIEVTPKTNIGKGLQIQDNLWINEADIPNILATVEHVPIACVLKFVGYNSPVIR